MSATNNTQLVRPDANAAVNNMQTGVQPVAVADFLRAVCYGETGYKWNPDDVAEALEKAGYLAHLPADASPEPGAVDELVSLREKVREWEEWAIELTSQHPERDNLIQSHDYRAAIMNMLVERSGRELRLRLALAAAPRADATDRYSEVVLHGSAKAGDAVSMIYDAAEDRMLSMKEVQHRLNMPTRRADATVGGVTEDAARWRWLRMQPYETFAQIGWSTWTVDADVASRRDQQVDAALRAAQPEQNGGGREDHI